MFKHILIPIDGSELSRRAATKGIELAKLCQGRITVLHIIPPFQTIAYMGALLAATEFAYNEQAKTDGEQYLQEVRAMADAAGVPFEGEADFGEQPNETILEVAKARQCDLIVMGSHGRRGMTRLLLGSETQKVLLGSPVPVLVCN
ncbi:universal stress protein [Dyella jiangningensis]|uniref:Universal stress protein n=1 Tax=Dyella jiangningensis TaxID=1379159 RepID=A0A328P751_9GAMM|nr:universal stress protein [Dyella jiangningensis]RAO78117.1 universal stress protein UspA [Dyella jiangningensis]